MQGNTERSSLTTSVIIGSLLGDGCITKNHNWVFEEQHTTKQKDYLYWKANKIPESKVRTFQRSFGQVYSLRTKTDLYYQELRTIWYPNGSRVVPQRLMDELDEIVLTIWYMDDGDKITKKRQSLKHIEGTVQYNVCRISTAAYTYKENLYLRRILHKKFGILPVVRNEKNTARGKSYYRLYFSKDNYDKFMEIIRRQFDLLQLPECMRYKLGERVENRRGITRKIMFQKGLIPKDTATGRFTSKRYVPTIM